MPSQGMFNLACELLHRSRDGKILWKPTIKDNVYSVHFPDVSLSTSYKTSTGTYSLDLIGETGDIVASLSWDPDCGTEWTAVGSGKFYYNCLREIYELAEAYIQKDAIERALGYMEKV